MKYLKRYVLLFPTVFFIVLGAVMPDLTSWMQDAQLNAYHEKTELKAVNLTLRQEDDVGPVLQLMSKQHTESDWAGKTVLTEAEAQQAALTVMETMAQYGLLPKGDLECFQKEEGNAQPQLLVGGDGSSALIWACTWDFDIGTFITLDDATGKAVRMLINNDMESDGTTENVYSQLEKWNGFLQDYYDIEQVGSNVHLYGIEQAGTKVYLYGYGANSTLLAQADLRYCSKDGATVYDFNLKITNNHIFFNYQVVHRDAAAAWEYVRN